MANTDNRAERRRQDRDRDQAKENGSLTFRDRLNANSGVLAFVAILLTIVMWLAGFVFWMPFQLGKFHSRFENLEDTVHGRGIKPSQESQISKVKEELGEKISTLEGKLNYIQGVQDGSFKKAALSKGFKEPTIQPVNFKQQQPQRVSYVREGKSASVSRPAGRCPRKTLLLSACE